MKEEILEGWNLIEKLVTSIRKNDTCYRSGHCAETINEASDCLNFT